MKKWLDQLHEQLKPWAASNTLTLILLSAGFVITWGVIVVMEVLYG